MMPRSGAETLESRSWSLLPMSVGAGGAETYLN